MLRTMTCLAACCVAAVGHGAQMYFGSAPPDAQNYLQVNLSFLDGEPTQLNVLAFVPEFSIGNINGGLPFWYPESASGAAEVYFDSSPPPPLVRLNFPIDLAPEISAGLSSVQLAVGPLVGDQRGITMTAAGGYTRSYVTTQVPEPTSTCMLVTLGLPLIARCIYGRTA